MKKVRLKKLRKYIRSQGKTFTEAAAEIGTSRVWLTEVINGNKNAGVALARKIRVWSKKQLEITDIIKE